jgi:hypothetical protein
MLQFAIYSIELKENRPSAKGLNANVGMIKDEGNAIRYKPTAFCNRKMGVVRDCGFKKHIFYKRSRRKGISMCSIKSIPRTIAISTNNWRVVNSIFHFFSGMKRNEAKKNPAQNNSFGRCLALSLLCFFPIVESFPTN